MRYLLASFAIFAAPLARAAPAAGMSLDRVWLQWHTADSFQSFYEYRTARELEGRKWTVLRSQPDERTGLYFLVHTENLGATVRGAKIVLRVITPDSTETRVFSFPVDVQPGGWLFEIGLTGKDWAAAAVRPVAWDVELQSPDGAVLATRMSYLWERPGH